MERPSVVDLPLGRTVPADAVQDARAKPRRIDHHMLDALTFPGVADVHQAIAGLDHRRIGKFVFCAVFQCEHALPVHAIIRERHRHRQRAAAVPPVLAGDAGVVDQQGAAVAQHDGVGAGVGILYIQQLHRLPMQTAIGRERAEEFVLLAATKRLHAAIGVQ